MKKIKASVHRDTSQMSRQGPAEWLDRSALTLRDVNEKFCKLWEVLDVQQMYAKTII